MEQATITQFSPYTFWNATYAYEGLWYFYRTNDIELIEEQ